MIFMPPVFTVGAEDLCHQARDNQEGQLQARSRRSSHPLSSPRAAGHGIKPTRASQGICPGGIGFGTGVGAALIGELVLQQLDGLPNVLALSGQGGQGGRDEDEDRGY
jgi:hypothetical protein